MKDELATTDAVGQAALVRSRQVKPSELVEAAIRRIEAGNDRLNAVIHPAFERALDRARQLDAAHTDFDDDSPPLLGVPFLMKDLGGQEAGAPFHMGIRALKNAAWVAPEDSYLVQRLRAAGVVSLGRTNTPELGLLPTTEPLAYGPTRNPWDLERSPGGSSGGASAAVAAGFVPAAHASDGGGSIRTPAAHTGLVGLKPTRGRSSFGPATGERWAGFSCELVVSRSVRDTAVFLDAIHGRMPGDPYSAEPPARPLRIGLMTTAPSSGIEVHPDCRDAVEAAAKTLAGLGHTVTLAHPEAIEDPNNIWHFVTVVGCNVARALETTADKIGRPVTRDDVEPLTWALAELAATLPAAKYIASIDAVHALGRRMAAWWEGGFDLLLTPTTAQPAPRIGELDAGADDPISGWTRSAPYGCFTSVFNQTGQPAISLPLHFGACGVPIGVQMVAAWGREDLLLRVAAQLEQAMPWRDRRPPGFT
jgi:amidase